MSFSLARLRCLVTLNPGTRVIINEIPGPGVAGSGGICEAQSRNWTPGPGSTIDPTVFAKVLLKGFCSFSFVEVRSVGRSGHVATFFS